ncbi:MAG: Crp/Fnr family transcriptional regulator [Nitrospirota bacterium]
MREKIWYLKRINLFIGMSKEELDVIAKMSREKIYKKKQVIYLPSDPDNTIFMIKTGKVKLYVISEDGKKFTFAILEPGEIFGELALIDDTHRDTVAEAYEDTYICVMNKTDFTNLIKKNPDMALKVTKLIGFRLKVIENNIQNLIFKNSKAKLAELILRLKDRFGINDQRGTFINLKITHQELADLTGLTRETVTYTLNDFKNTDMIEIIDKRIIVKKESELKRVQ